MNPQNNIVFIFGAGALQNSWNPIIKSFKEITNLSLDQDGANFMLARLVYLLRFYSTSEHVDATKSLAGIKNNVNLLKAEIARQLKIAQDSGEICVWNEFERILTEIIFKGDNRYCIISTNWDTVVDNAINEFGKKIGSPTINTFHLHGSIDEPNSMYLPSEVTFEPYRTIEEVEKHGINHAHMINFLQKANQVVFYGLSLDPLDAELSQTLSGGLNSSNLKEVIVINPDYHKVSNRVDLILADNYHKIKITSYDPTKIK